jgi:hypothetical protein
MKLLTFTSRKVFVYLNLIFLGDALRIDRIPDDYSPFYTLLSIISSKSPRSLLHEKNGEGASHLLKKYSS